MKVWNTLIDMQMWNHSYEVDTHEGWKRQNKKNVLCFNWFCMLSVNYCFIV